MKKTTMFGIYQKSQEELKSYVAVRLKGFGYTVVETKDYVYATYKDSLPVMMVAHLDTVHSEKCKNVFHDVEQDVLWSPEGIGGDDRNGVISIIMILEKGYRPEVLFTTDEEIGGIGASYAANEITKPNVKYLIELDRKGSDDCVFYDCENKKFKKYVKKYGFEESYGSYSDICTLSDEWDIASVNLSIGYYNAHTKQEYVKLQEMYDVIEKVCRMLDDSKKAPIFDYQRSKNTFSSGFNTGYNYGKSYGKYGKMLTSGSYDGWDSSWAKETTTKKEDSYCPYCGKYHPKKDMIYDKAEGYEICKGCAVYFGVV